MNIDAELYDSGNIAAESVHEWEELYKTLSGENDLHFFIEKAKKYRAEFQGQLSIPPLQDCYLGFLLCALAGQIEDHLANHIDDDYLQVHYFVDTCAGVYIERTDCWQQHFITTKATLDAALVELAKTPM